MAIADEDVAKVREATDLLALIGEHTALKRVGRRYVGLCPFHGEKSPSFSVNIEQGLYYCFGCQASGDAITFVRAVDGCDFVDAVERLAGRAGVVIHNDAGGTDASRGRRQKLYDAMAAAADFYHSYLLSAPEAGRARQYLRARGYDGDIVRKFKIGFAADRYDELVRGLKLPGPVLLEAGLAYENSQRRLQDVFRERIIFPIFDPGNKVIALGGRILPDDYRKSTRDPGPKYRNSPESSIYQKRATLYGLNFSKTEIGKVNEAIVCEGYTDVIGFHTAELGRAVATCGTALTEEHFKLLSRFAKRVVLCFDADAAGQNAAARIYEWERRHELELAVAELPAGSDPAELARTDPNGLREAIAHAKPFLGFRVERALNSASMTSPEGRTRAAEAALVAIAEHPNELVRDQYLVQVADRTHHDPDSLRNRLRDRPKDQPTSREQPTTEQRPDNVGQPVTARPKQSTTRKPQSSAVSSNALALAIHRPEDVAHLLSEELFNEAVEREAFRALAAELSLHDAIAHAGPDAAEILSQLAVRDDVEDINVEETFILLVRAAATRARAEVDSSARVLEREGNADFSELAATNRWLNEQLNELVDILTRPGHRSPAMDAAEALLAWLKTRAEPGE